MVSFRYDFPRYMMLVNNSVLQGAINIVSLHSSVDASDHFGCQKAHHTTFVTAEARHDREA